MKAKIVGIKGEMVFIKWMKAKIVGIKEQSGVHQTNENQKDKASKENGVHS